MPEAWLDRAATAWSVVIHPFPLYSDVLFMVYIQHREHPFRFLHGQYKTLREAQMEEKRLRGDLDALRCDKFQEKYRIGYDLKGSLL